VGRSRHLFHGRIVLLSPVNQTQTVFHEHEYSFALRVNSTESSFEPLSCRPVLLLLVYTANTWQCRAALAAWKKRSRWIGFGVVNPCIHISSLLLEAGCGVLWREMFSGVCWWTEVTEGRQWFAEVSADSEHGWMTPRLRVTRCCCCCWRHAVNDAVLYTRLSSARARRRRIQFTVARKLQDYQAYLACGALSSERNPSTATCTM